MKICKEIKKDFKKLKHKSQRRNLFFFMFSFLFFFIVLFFILNNIFFTKINYVLGFSVSSILSLLFIANTFVFDTSLKLSTIFITSIDYPIVIDSLCTGILEFSLLGAFILGSVGIFWKKRIIGFLFSIFIVFIFNIFRIIITTLSIIYLNISFANFMHAFFFRLFLIIVVIGTYYFWFMWANKNR